MKKILITGGTGMLAHDFNELFSGTYQISLLAFSELDITKTSEIEKKVAKIQPDIILNCAAYTNVDDAEDIGMKKNYDVNTLGVYNLAKVSQDFGIDFITLSSDYVFSGDIAEGYTENQIENPLNQYGMAKYLGEQLAFQENKNAIIIRTSWLYGGGSEYNNFVNTMIKLGNKLDSLKIVADQYGNPTNCKDLSKAIGELIENIGTYRGEKLHFSNTTPNNGITWYDFATHIFAEQNITVNATACTSEEFPTKASRPNYSKLKNNSDIVLRDWKEGLKDYLNGLR